MLNNRLKVFLIGVIQLVFYAYGGVRKPHIIFVVADDLGWNDVGFRNPHIKTPFIDEAAKNGIILNSSYVLPMCTPSRSTLMTGRYSFKTGVYGDVISFFANWGIPLQFKLLPQAMKELGYNTNFIGKWNLGSCNESYLPNNRGLDTFFGFLGPAEHYYTHGYSLVDDNTKPSIVPQVYDFWNQTTPSVQYNGTHSSTPYMIQFKTILENRNPDDPMFVIMAFQEPHVPIEVDSENVLWFPKEENQYRRGYSAIVKHLDNSFGLLINMLKDYGIYNDTIIILTSDNGGDFLGGGNNYPLRGAKGTLFEGGTRASAFIHSPLLEKTGFTYNGSIHAVDWFPMITGLAGGKHDPELDGMDIWRSIINNEPSPREEFVYSLITDPQGNLTGAIRYKQWKLIIGNAGIPNTHIKPEEVSGTLYNSCGGIGTLQEENPPFFRLYNIHDDPNESQDLAGENDSVVKDLYEKVKRYQTQMVKPVARPNNIDLYKAKTSDLKILNTNWCDAIETVLSK
ncbi:Arylsulfatase [Chamberlinius hualienensis]